MNRRIFGIETEYGLLCADAGDEPVSVELAARILFKPLVESGRSSNVYWRNGGRIYLDVGAHPEYATAECDRVEDLLLQDRAGDYLFADLARRADEALANCGTGGKIHLFRNNEDFEGHSFGCHENYLLRRRSNFRQVVDALVSFFVTRQILTGAGHIHRDGKPRFGYSSRAIHMSDAVSSATTRSRPIINTRDEPLADASEYRRLHVIVGDTNVSESSTALKVVMTDLLLSAVENGVRIEDLALKDPLASIRAIDDELGSNIVVELENGRTMTVVALQRELRRRVLDHVDLDSASPLVHRMVDLWDRGLVAVETGEHGLINTELDWAIKRDLIVRFMERSGADLLDPRVSRLELAYHDITGKTVAERLEESGAMVRLTAEADTRRAMDTPPASTRAHLRGQLIAAAEQHRRDFKAEWKEIGLFSGEQWTSVILPDPFATEDPRIDEMIEKIQTDNRGPRVFA
ncbi:MAG: proteasome accessory factor PafA2 family protein [Actinomycetaceae bacterium]|nr:proteasome accessory factor PafA2 family protein [Actinomycetaceae bacterium]